MIVSLQFSDDLFLVTLAQNPAPEDHSTTVDIFDRQGNLLFYGIRVAGFIIYSDSRFFLVKYIKDEYGSFEISELLLILGNIA